MWFMIEINFSDPLWIASQVAAFIALVFMVWSFQIKKKLKMMMFLGAGTLFLAISASFLENYTLAVLFGLASVRNFVFCYLDWRTEKGKYVAKWLPYFFAGVFITLTIVPTILLVYVWRVPSVGPWLEWLICITLIGLIIGNVLEGTNIMRISFVANRAFNIINHVYFVNVIAVFIAAMAIVSNIVFYVRQLIAWQKKRKQAELQAQEPEQVQAEV